MNRRLVCVYINVNVCIWVTVNVKSVMRNLLLNSFSKISLIIAFKENLFKDNIIIKWKDKIKIQIKNLRFINVIVSVVVFVKNIKVYKCILSFDHEEKCVDCVSPLYIACG